MTVVVAIAAGMAGWLLMMPPEPAPQQTVAEADDPILALPTGPSIAVLPLVNLNGDSEQEYFVDGLTEDIITRLSRFPRFWVIARNSTYQYKGRAIDVREVGRDLGARYIVEGSIRKSGDKIRVARWFEACT